MCCGARRCRVLDLCVRRSCRRLHIGSVQECSARLTDNIDPVRSAARARVAAGQLQIFATHRSVFGRAVRNATNKIKQVSVYLSSLFFYLYHKFIYY